jgi:hypothetical protein
MQGNKAIISTTLQHANQSPTNTRIVDSLCLQSGLDFPLAVTKGFAQKIPRATMPDKVGKGKEERISMQAFQQPNFISSSSSSTQTRKFSNHSWIG